MIREEDEGNDELLFSRLQLIIPAKRKKLSPEIVACQPQFDRRKAA